LKGRCYYLYIRIFFNKIQSIAEDLYKWKVTMEKCLKDDTIVEVFIKNSVDMRYTTISAIYLLYIYE